jgi:thiol-disulfide isomerase/thioredoxin
MKRVSATFLAVALTVTVLPVPSFAQSPSALPGCEPAPEVRKAFDEKLNDKDLEKMKFSDRAALQREVYEELMAKYPRQVEPYNRLIVDAHGDPIWYSALQERFRKQAAQRPDDPLALYVAGFALFGTDTLESLRLLEAAKAKAPQFPWPSLLLAGAYLTGKRMDRQKSSANLAAFFAVCPDSTNEWAQMLLGTDPELQPKVAKALRARLATEADPARLKDYGTLWSLEFRTHAPQEHDALRKQVATDLKRIESLNPKPDSAWQAFLINGYKQAGASPETITTMEDRLLREYPHSGEAYHMVYERWEKANKKPEDQKDNVAWARYHEAYKDALKGWIHDFPDRVGHEAWFNAIFYEDSLTEKDGVVAMDEYLRHNAEYDSPDNSFPKLHAAEFLLNHKWQLTRALDLLEQAKTVSDMQRALQSPEDNLTEEAQDDFNERKFASDLHLVGEILRAAQLAGRPDAAKALKPLVEGPPPAQGKLQSAYWWNRARLAALEGRKPDALAYYQLSLQTRSESPQYSHGKFRDDLTDEAQALWMEAGGTLAAWAVWSKPFATKGTELAQGIWEKPKKTLPAFELSDLSGKTWRLKDLGGKAVLINLWATWCVLCQAELPNLQKLYEQTKGRSDIQILSFDLDEDLGLVTPFLNDKGYTFPVLPAYSLVNNLQVGIGYDGIPQNWVLDPKGNWIWTQMGYGGEDNWGQVMLQKLESAERAER